MHGKAKLVKDQLNIDVQYDSRISPKKKMKTDNEENLDSSRSVAQAKESANSANTLNVESISKSENSAKLSVVIVLSTETSSTDES